MVKRVAAIGVAMLGLSLARSPADAQSRRTGTVVGRVTDSASTRVAGATISVAEERQPAPKVASDNDGSFRLRGVDVGTAHLIARHPGYAPETVLVVVVEHADATANFVLHMLPVQLDGQTIDADPLRGKMGSFNTRKRRGVGAFITRDEIERRQPGSISELLRYLPGIGVSQRMAGEPQPVRMNRSASSSMQATCVVQLYVDGHPYPNGNVDDFQPLSIEGIEVYRSASEIPADFRTQDATCGVIALWTRDPDSARRKP